MSERPPAFLRAEGELRCEQVTLDRLAERFGTPLYVYSATTIGERYRAFAAAFRSFPHTVCYSVKANSNLAILRLLARAGAGFDVVSGGELARVRKLGGRADVVFSGVGKTAAEMDAALRSGILLFNVESEGELELLAARAESARKRAAIAIRVNPDVRTATHPYISTGLREHKFGVPIGEAMPLYRRAGQDKWLVPAGVSVHIGSQITDIAPFAETMQRLAELVAELRGAGIKIRYVDAGGGLGIPYEQPDRDFPARLRAYADAITTPLRKATVHLLLEPGRVLVGPAGALLTRVLYLKRNGSKQFVVTDGAMNDLIRPSLYGAYHEVTVVNDALRRSLVADVVGPICETGDFFARDRELPPVAPGDLLAVLDAGAYGMSLASNYNSRPRAAEVMVEGRKVRLIRRRERVEDLWRNEP
jgi:diaminopimelate decarboxylase